MSLALPSRRLLLSSSAAGALTLGAARAQDEKRLVPKAPAKGPKP